MSLVRVGYSWQGDVAHPATAKSGRFRGRDRIGFSLEDFTGAAFGELGRSRRARREVATASDMCSKMCSKGNPRKAYAGLGWKSSYTMPDVVRMMVHAELNEGKAEIASYRRQC
jgi:hypothetical protein